MKVNEQYVLASVHADEELLPKRAVRCQTALLLGVAMTRLYSIRTCLNCPEDRPAI